MKKNLIDATSKTLLAAISCATCLNVMHPSLNVINDDVPSNKYKVYCMQKTTTQSAIINNESSSVLSNCGQYIEVNVAKKMYVTTNVNVRTKDNMKSKVVKVLKRSTPVQVFEKQNNGWSRILYKNKIRYIYSKYLSKNKPKKIKNVKKQVYVEKLGNYIEYTAPSGHHQKSYMDWKFITSPSSKQYKLKQTSYIGDYGIIMNQGRYCVALGSGYIKTGVGTKFDLILVNGTVIPCIAGDMKADAHTDSSNRITSHDGSIAEFIVNTNSLTSSARRMGDVSYSCPSWNSEIAKIRVYQ